MWVLSLSLQVITAKELQVVAGAGPSTQPVTEFIQLLSKTPEGKIIQFKVPQKSIKHKGGLVNTERFIFGRTGRPLFEKEKSQGLEELILSRVPVTIIVGERSGVRSLTIEKVCQLFQGKIRNWNEVGGANLDVVVFTREQTEAMFLTLRKSVPCFVEVISTKYVFKKDHQVLSAFQKLKIGKQAIGFGAFSNFPPQLRLEVPGFNVGIGNGLVYKKENRNHPLVKRARSLAKTKLWQTRLKQLGLMEP